MGGQKRVEQALAYKKALGKWAEAETQEQGGVLPTATAETGHHEVVSSAPLVWREGHHILSMCSQLVRLLPVLLIFVERLDDLLKSDPQLLCLTSMTSITLRLKQKMFTMASEGPPLSTPPLWLHISTALSALLHSSHTGLLGVFQVPPAWHPGTGCFLSLTPLFTNIQGALSHISHVSTS